MAVHEPSPEPVGYRDVLRHGVFVAFVALNVVFVAAGYAQLELLPVFAQERGRRDGDRRSGSSSS